MHSPRCDEIKIKVVEKCYYLHVVKLYALMLGLHIVFNSRYVLNDLIFTKYVRRNATTVTI